MTVWAPVSGKVAAAHSFRAGTAAAGTRSSAVGSDSARLGKAKPG